MLVLVFLFASAFYTPGATQDATIGDPERPPSPPLYSFYYPFIGFPGCTYDRCTPTCSIPQPRNCPPFANPCGCPSGTVVSKKGGKCIEREQCEPFISCNGDKNARYTYCPVGCPSTCAKPNARLCGAQCDFPGCECKPGFLRASTFGKCILPEQCPGGKVCGKNENFVSCSVECPSLYCPENDTRVGCGAPWPCPSGCTCKPGYLRRSTADPTCIPAKECPPGKCSKENEVWNRCVQLCYSDNCNDRNTTSVPTDCPFSSDECYPLCICKKGYSRTNEGKCIPNEECPPFH